uniref:Uncharacterized protein n=1 Tax=Rhizophora mucronata TaxID=61149 RepID=A0A2P2QTR4_RHIMU
MPISLAMNRTP